MPQTIKSVLSLVNNLR